MQIARLAILAALVATPALAQSAPPAPPSANAVMAQCNLDRGALYGGLSGTSTALGQAQQQIEALSAQLAQAKKDLAVAQKNETKKSLPVKK